MRKKNLPTSVRGAVRRGWHPVLVTQAQRVKHNVSHMGLHIWCQFNVKGNFKATFDPSHNESKLAFEDAEDAFWFNLKWQ